MPNREQNGLSTPSRNQTSAEPIVLVVEDDRAIAKAIARLAPKEVTPQLVGSVEEAQAVLDDHFSRRSHFSGAIVDIGLPDGSGLEVVRVLREHHATVPILVLTSQLDRALINQAHALGAEYVCKPEFDGNLRAFFDRVAHWEIDDNRGAFAEAIDRVCTEHGLTKRQSEIVSHATDGVPRGHLAEVLGVSENTLKTQIRALLDKTSQTSLSELVWMVRNAAS